MAYRDDNPGIIETLRRLESRIVRLEKGGGTKQNNVRLSDWVTTVDDNGCISVTNVVTGTVRTICDDGDEKVLWSYPGDIIESELPTDGGGPLWYPSGNIQITGLELYVQTNSFAGGYFIQAALKKSAPYSSGVPVLTTIATVRLEQGAVKESRTVFTIPNGTLVDGNGANLGTWTNTANTTTGGPTTAFTIEITASAGEGTGVIANDLTFGMTYRPARGAV